MRCDYKQVGIHCKNTSIAKNKIMKKIKNSFIVIMMLLASFTFSSCEKVDELLQGAVSECDDPANQIDESIEFNLRCIVQYADSQPAYDLYVFMDIHKEYCDGTTKGFFQSDALTNRTDPSGHWNSNWEYTYKYGNIKDRVLVTYTVETGDELFDEIELHRYDVVYRWEDVSDDIWGYITDTPILVLPYKKK